MPDEINQLTRRDALTFLSGAALAPKALASLPDNERVPWYATMRRCGQTNFNERDPIELNIPWWVDYWVSLKLDALLLSAGGIMAFYPTKIPFQHRSQFLDGHDLFGDYATAARERGIRVVARLDCNYVYEDAYKARPEWVERTADGKPLTNAESPWLYKTCMYSTYFTEQMPAIIREINFMYDVDGFFTNGWPGTDPPELCYCEACQGSNLSDRNSPEAFDRHLARVLEIWQLWDHAAKEKKWDSVYVGNLGGGIRAVTNLSKIASVAGWFNADHQGRAGFTPVWNCAQQGRVAQCVMKGRTITNVTGAYANTQPLWRHTSKAPLEMKMWLAQTTASGMTPWFHWLGGKPQDLRWREPGRKFFQWIAENERHFINESSLANLAVVFAQRTNAYYKAPPKSGGATDYLEGMYQVLLQGRVPFDFVHEDELTPGVLSKYKGLILANAALLSDQQCQQLRDYVNRGGSLLATFETGFYDEYARARSECGLSDVFGIQKRADVVGPNGNASYAHIEGPDHPILRGFSDTSLLPFAQHYVPLRAIPNPVLTVIPPFPAFPPEMVYPRITQTDEPAIVLQEREGSRVAFFPGDIDSSYWRSQDPDLSRLLLNTIRWMCPQSPVTVLGEGMAEVFAWKTKAGFAVHLLNYGNPEMLRGWFTEPYPLGPQKVRVTLPAGAKVSKVHLLAAGAELPATSFGNTIEFTVPQVPDYEVAAIV